MKEIITRTEAKALGLTRYYSGKPCPHGHNTDRSVANGSCVSCVLARVTTWKNNNRERHNASNRRSKANRSDKIKAYNKQYKQENKALTNANTRRRQATQLNATPSWYEKEAVDLLYVKASNYGFEVDHIVPLLSETVCGLHCWSNLQLLDPALNRSKGNRSWPDMS